MRWGGTATVAGSPASTCLATPTAGSGTPAGRNRKRTPLTLFLELAHRSCSPGQARVPGVQSLEFIVVRQRMYPVPLLQTGQWLYAVQKSLTAPRRRACPDLTGGLSQHRRWPARRAAPLQVLDPAPQLDHDRLPACDDLQHSLSAGALEVYLNSHDSLMSRSPAMGVSSSSFASSTLNCYLAVLRIDSR